MIRYQNHTFFVLFSELVFIMFESRQNTFLVLRPVFVRLGRSLINTTSLYHGWSS